MEQNNTGGMLSAEPANNADNSSNQNQNNNSQAQNSNSSPNVERNNANSSQSAVSDNNTNTNASQPKDANNQDKDLNKKADDQNKAKSLLESENAEYKWPDEWKKIASNGDEKLMKTADKFKTPADLLTAYKELQAQYSKTRAIPELPKDATPEQVKEYREQVGIPESWEKYDTNLDGISIGEADKPVVDDFLKRAHEKNLKSSEVKNALQAYFEIANERNAELIKKAELQTTEVQNQLKSEWGAMYKDNISLISNHLSKEIGKEDLDKLNSAVLADGTYLINNPKILNYLLKDAKANNSSHTLTPNAHEYSSLQSRKEEIEKIMKESPKAFYGNSNLSDEYKKIVDALRSKSS